MSNPWGSATAGAWALDSERAEEEERQEAAAAAIAGEPAQSFPSLKEAAATKPKKKKPVSMSLSQFTTGSYSAPKGLTPNEIIRLPTGPRERSAEELEQGRGFRSYGYGSSGGGGGGGSRDADASWSGGGGGRRPYGGGFDEEQRRGGPPDRDSDQPSRADEVDNWAAGKKAFAPSGDRYNSHGSSGGDRYSSIGGGGGDRYSSIGGGGGGDRYSSLGSGSGGDSSRADDVDNWSLGKKPIPARNSSFGSGFRDPVPSTNSDRWVRGSGGAPPPSNGDRERPKLVLAPPKADVGGTGEPARTRPSPFGTARPREEVLKEKGLDWKKLDLETSRPTSSHSSRPTSSHSSRPGSPGSLAPGAEGAPPARVKVNPFGDAKPREVLLQERGKDWRKMDSKLEHGRVDRAETEEEKQLKEEISSLKKSLTKEMEENPSDFPSQAGLREQINQKENHLELLSCELDDKVRFGQRPTGPPQPGMLEDSRGMEFPDRPRSRGRTGNAWDKPMDERRRPQGGRESSFFGSRSMERPKSREGW